MNNTGDAGGDGISNTPFNALAAAEGAVQIGHYVFVHSGSGTTTGRFTLKASQTLSGTNILASNATVSALNVSTGASTGIAALAGAPF